MGNNKYHAVTRRKYRDVPKLARDKPEVVIRYRGGTRNLEDICDRCPHLIECSERQRLGLWMLCEIPDALDLKMIEGVN
jgi:hypothetical protein